MLSPGEWERRLTAHYLRSDGPLGGAPITFIDATPAEIAIASGVERLTDAQAQPAFLTQFDRRSVQAWFNGQRLPSRRDGEYPGYFRYLLLTCLLSTTEEGAGYLLSWRRESRESAHAGVSARSMKARVWLRCLCSLGVRTRDCERAVDMHSWSPR